MTNERKWDSQRTELLQTVVDRIPAMVAYWDANQRCRFANRAYEKWFGVRPESVVGMTMKELLGPLYALNLPHIERALKGEEQEFEREIPDPAHGPPRHSQAHYVPDIVNGEVRGFCVLVADITRRVHAEQALQSAQQQLETRERLAAMATLAAGIAHEINNPLSAVLGNVELSLAALDEEGPLDVADLRSMLLDARIAADRVREIVQSMRLLARGDAVQRERVNVAACIEQSIAFAANTLRYKARLIRDVDAALSVDANVGQLSQVLVNLLANAARGLPEDAAGRNEIRVTARRAGDQAVIEVADNGRGIPEKLLSRIFEPFSRTADTGEGLGLGLSISRNLIEGFGGTISVSSRLGQGTVFRVLLPVASSAVAPSEQPGPGLRPPSSAPPPASGVRPRLLIVDDEQAVAKLVGHILAGEGYDVTAVTSGREALAALQQKTFDLILCDLMMPELTGQDVYVAATRTWPELTSRFVFLTGGAFTPRGRQFIASVNVPVLEKPFHVDELCRLVRERLWGTPAQPLSSVGG